MYNEYKKYIKEYFSLINLSKPLFAAAIFTSIAFKFFVILLPFIAALIIKSLLADSIDQTYFYIVLYFIAGCLGQFFKFLNYQVSSYNTSYIYKTLHNKVFNKLIGLDSRLAEKINKGAMMNIINNDIIDTSKIGDDLSEIITIPFQIITVISIVSFSNPFCALLMILFVFLYFLVKNYADKKYNNFWWKTLGENDKFSGLLSQVVSGLSEVKIFNILPKFNTKLFNIERRHKTAYRQEMRYYTIRNVDVDILDYIFRVILYITIIYFIFNGNLTVDILVLIIGYHTQLVTYIQNFINSTADIRFTSVAVNRVNRILSYRAKQQKIHFGKLNQDIVDGNLELKNISLTLDRQTILKDINLKIKPHEFIAIVGYPGSGKTSIFNLILRLIKPTHGKILLDGINIDRFSRTVYTSNVAIANQTPFIFDASIRKNLDFVDTDIKHQIEACKIVGVHSFIETLPQGYNTILHENANNISNGHKQLISIARTILTDAEILLFDDVTTSLDVTSAKSLPKVIKRLKEKHTVIMITKRPELMMAADRIVVLNKGKISDIGTHEKLLKRSKIYRDMQTAIEEKQEGTDV